MIWRAKLRKLASGRSETIMQVKTFLLTLGAGMLGGAAVTMLLPEQCAVRRTAQDAVDSAKQAVSDMLQ